MTYRGHSQQTCPTPSASRRLRHALWICPDCGKAFTLRKTAETPDRRGYFDAPVWQWWPWTGGA